jgi:hypothetical protein
VPKKLKASGEREREWDQQRKYLLGWEIGMNGRKER